MLEYQEMVALSDQFSVTIGGRWSVDVVKLRNELKHNYGLSEYVVQHVIFTMLDKGLIPNG